MILLVGPPNVGKTALFNALTGSRQKVANYAGVTIDAKIGHRAIEGSPNDVEIVDLPGVYSLEPLTPEEELVRSILFQSNKKAPEGLDRPIDLMIVVIDVTQLDRGLALVFELKKCGLPLVVALNRYDLLERFGLTVDVAELERGLGVRVVPTVAVKKQGIDTLVSELSRWVRSGFKRNERVVWTHSDEAEVRERFAYVDELLSRARRKLSAGDRWTRRLDRFFLHPIFGPLSLVCVLVLLFQSVFNMAGIPQGWIEEGTAWFQSWVSETMPEGVLRSLVVDGVIAGVGSVVVFLPQILLLFLFILALEDSGYMARAAVLLDRPMRKVGLHGRALIPLLSSYACAVPGIMATRTIPDAKDRLATILIAPLTTCSARLPVYTLLIGAFIPNTPVLGPLRLQGLVMVGLYALGLLTLLGVGFVLKRTILKSENPILLLELPSYQWPTFRSLVIGIRERTQAFLKRAGTLILGFSILLWVLVNYPKPPTGATGPAIHYSWAGRMGQAIEPVIRPLGFDWRIGISLVPGMAAREVVIGALATIYAKEESLSAPQMEGAGGGSTEDAEAAFLTEKISNSWSLATAWSLLVWYVFAPQCISTLAVIRRETRSWVWPLATFAYLMALAYGMSLLTYQSVRVIFN